MCANDGNTEPELIEERKGLFVPFIPVVSIMAGIADNYKEKVPTLAEFISVQSSDADFRSTFPSVEKQNTRFNIDSDRKLVRVSPLNGTSQ